MKKKFRLMRGCEKNVHLRKTWMIMKLTTFLFFMAITQMVASEAYSQTTKMTLQLKGVAVKQVLDQIEDKSEFFFLYNSKLVDVNRKVSVDAKDERIDEILNGLFQETGVVYTVVDRQIVLTNKADQAGFMAQSNQQQGKKVTGKVTDSTGASLPGVSVVVKGTTTGVVTDNSGTFSLANIPENATLQFSFVGMKMQEIAIGNKTTMNVALGEETIGVDEVVVVGYGTQKKINLTGAIEQVTSKDLAKKSVSNMGQALQGLIPNLNVTTANGNPVANASYNIRGGTSFSGGSFQTGTPLILVDGVPMDINNLSPDDIDNITVIKDASASAIYGARASYGVILVTTKKGNKDSTPQIMYSGSSQVQVPVNDPGLLNSVEYQQAIMNATTLEGGNPSADDNYKLTQVNNYFNNPETAQSYYMNGSAIVWVGNVNPWKEVIRKSTPMQNHLLSVSGGGSKSSYHASFGYRDQDGIMKQNQDFKKTYNASLGFSTEVTNWLKIDTKAIYTLYNSQIPHGFGGYVEGANYFEFMAMQGWRNLMTPLLTPTDSPVGTRLTANFANGMQGNIKTKSGTLMLKVGATVKIIDGLSFKTDFAYRTINTNEKLFLPLFPNIDRSWTPRASEGNSTVKKTHYQSDYTVYNAYLDFSKNIAEKHELAMVAGFNQELYQDESLWAQGQDLVSDNIPVLQLASGVRTLGDGESHWAIRGAFGRFNYIFDKKYLFEMNGRYDGTSKFPKDSRFKFFPSFSAGWRISEEVFMKGLQPIIPNLKLRASYGSLGNQDVANYAYISTYGLTPQVGYVINGTRPIGITPPGLVSSNLTWETASTLDFGVDVTVLDKLTLNYDWYNRKTKAILTSAEKLPSVLGTSVPNQNSGSMKTTGWEFSARWNDRLKNGLSYSIAFVLSDNQSEIISYSGNPQKLISSLYQGKKMGEIWGYESENIFQTYEEIANAPNQSKINGGVWRPGDVRYKDLNNDKIIGFGSTTVNDPGDKKILGNSTPRYQYGLNIDVAWKSLDFNIFWQGTGERDYWTDSYYYWGLIKGSNINGGSGTKYTYYDSWTPERTNAFFPAFKPALKNKEVQSRYMLNAAYARLKNITFGYTLPQWLSKKIAISKLRVYASGYNLLTISKVPDVLDPELMGDAYPMLHSYTFGVQVTF
ncbi:MAG: TonB-dependent receptor [Mariniphaga sp.]|nr:TonB-dependent receptor [Mariniphaga sp.]